MSVLPGGAGHAAMQQVLEQIIQPAARRFKPDLILVSAGEQHWHNVTQNKLASALLPQAHCCCCAAQHMSDIVTVAALTNSLMHCIERQHNVNPV
jgi:hypothetical protein